MLCLGGSDGLRRSQMERSWLWQREKISPFIHLHCKHISTAEIYPLFSYFSPYKSKLEQTNNFDRSHNVLVLAPPSYRENPISSPGKKKHLVPLK
jgi:hypothetical protein